MRINTEGFNNYVSKYPYREDGRKNRKKEHGPKPKTLKDIRERQFQYSMRSSGLWLASCALDPILNRTVVNLPSVVYYLQLEEIAKLVKPLPYRNDGERKVPGIDITHNAFLARLVSEEEGFNIELSYFTPITMIIDDREASLMGEFEMRSEQLVEGRNESLEVSVKLGSECNLLVIGSEMGCTLPNGVQLPLNSEIKRWLN